jgi:carboxymethylenebutenolidase
MAGSIVTFKANGGTSQGYLAIAENGKGPGVVVMQEWWGLVDHIKDVCDRFAAAGFTALAPDMYDGQKTKSPDEAGKMMMALNIAETEKKLRGAVTYLAEHEAVSSRQVGTVGFCMGGQLSIFAATLNDRVGACVVFYGIHPNVKPNYSQLSGPVLGLFAENDTMVTPEVRQQLEKDIRSVGKSIEVWVYPGTNHAFFNDTRPEVYNEEAATDAWERVLAFLKQNLPVRTSQSQA